MTAGMSNYYRDRAAAERKAAERAAGPRERLIHLELAERYSQLVIGHERFSWSGSKDTEGSPGSSSERFD